MKEMYSPEELSVFEGKNELEYLNMEVLSKMIEESFGVLPIPYNKTEGFVTKIFDIMKEIGTKTNQDYFRSYFDNMFPNLNRSDIEEQLEKMTQNSYTTYCFVTLNMQPQGLEKLNLVLKCLKSHHKNVMIMPILYVEDSKSLSLDKRKVYSNIMLKFEDVGIWNKRDYLTLYNFDNSVEKVVNTGCQHPKPYAKNSAGGTKFYQCNICKADLGDI